MQVKEKKHPYLLSIDVMRAVAILFMVLIHFVNNLSQREYASAFYYDLANELGSFSAPAFSFLVGLSFWLWYLRESKRGRSEEEIKKIIFRRSIFLFFAGLTFATFIWLPASVFDWDILTFLGAATIIIFSMRKLPVKVLLGSIFVVLLLSPPLREFSGYAIHWDGAEYLYEFTMRDMVFGFLLEGYFPIFPWITFPLLGLIVGKVYFGANPSQKLEGWGLPSIGVALMLVAKLASQIGSESQFYFSEVTFYPASTTFILGVMGIILLS